MTVDLQIERPIQISMNMVEVEEERFPSFKIDLKCTVKHPTGIFLYKADDIWFDCEVWNTFTQELSKAVSGSFESAKLTDLSEQFYIEIKAEKNSCLFQLKCCEPETREGEAQLEYKKTIDNDTIGAIQRAFSDFPVWWQ